MTTNLMLDDLEEGWYSVGVKGDWNEEDIGPQDYNVHIYSDASPVHLYEG